MNLAEELANAGYRLDSESDSDQSEHSLNSENLNLFLNQQNKESLDEFRQRIFGKMDGDDIGGLDNDQQQQFIGAHPPPGGAQPQAPAAEPNPWVVISELNAALNIVKTESNNKFLAQENNIANLNNQVYSLYEQNKELSTRLNNRKQKNKLKILRFDGDTMEWPLYKRTFISACVNNEMDDGESKRALQHALSMNTLWQVFDINIEKSPYLEMTFEKFLELVDSRFNPLSREINARALFEQMRQGSTEPMEKFANKIRALYEAAYPNASDESTNERIMIDKFVQGIYDGRLRINILEKQPKTLTEALNIVTERMSYNLTAEYYATGKPPTAPPTGAKLMLGDGSPEDYSMGAVKAVPGEESNVAAIRGQGAKKSSFKCHFCGLEGHYARDCYKKKNQAANRGRGGGGQRRGQGRGRRGPLMKQGGNKPERPSGKGRGYKPAHGIHAMTQEEDEGVNETYEDEDSSNSGEE